MFDVEDSKSVMRLSDGQPDGIRMWNGTRYVYGINPCQREKPCIH